MVDRAALDSITPGVATACDGLKLTLRGSNLLLPKSLAIAGAPAKHLVVRSSSEVEAELYNLPLPTGNQRLRVVLKMYGGQTIERDDLLSLRRCPMGLDQDRVEIPFPTTDLPPAVGDLDGDGIDDLVLASSRALYVLRGTPKEGFLSQAILATGSLPLSNTAQPILADQNGDKRLDILLNVEEEEVDPEDHYAYIHQRTIGWLNDGNLRFKGPERFYEKELDERRAGGSFNAATAEPLMGSVRLPRRRLLVKRVPP